MFSGRGLGTDVEARGSSTRVIVGNGGRNKRFGWCCLPIPFKARAQHEVDDVAVLDAVFFQQLAVCESFATQEKTLRVRGRRSGLPRELRFDI